MNAGAMQALQNPAQAATCSCAGVPLLSYIDTSAIDKGQLFINYTAEDHEISDLVSGTQDVPDETRRERNSFSHVVSASYAFTDHWSISGLVSYVEHFRLINSSFLGETTSSGIGDSVLLARYTPLAITPFSRHQFSVGLGARIPTGDDDAGGDFVLSEDMQPSIGAYGAIIWTQYSYAFNQAATLLFHTSANYTYNGENDRKYRFGHDFYVSAEIPNTGGEWLDIIPAIQFGITDRFSAALSGRYPLWRDLNGTLQFTTSYSYALSLTYGF